MVRSLGFFAALFTALSCRTPTEIEVSLQGRGLTCEDGAPFAHFESGVLVRERFSNQREVDAALDTEKSYASSRSCSGLSDPALTDLGSSVVVPTELPERVEVLAVAGFDRDPNDEVAPPSVLRCLEFFDPEKAECPEDQPACRSCIFATRSLAFLEFSSLKLSVELDTRCAGIICPEGQTCFQGECESNAVSCEALGCTIPGELGGHGGAGGEGGVGGQGGGGEGAGGAGGAGIWLTTELGEVADSGLDLYGITGSEGVALFVAHGSLSRVTPTSGALEVTSLLEDISRVGGPAFGTSESDVAAGQLTATQLNYYRPSGVMSAVTVDACPNGAQLVALTGSGPLFSTTGSGGCGDAVRRGAELIARDVSLGKAAIAGGLDADDPGYALWTRSDAVAHVSVWSKDRELIPELSPNGASFIDVLYERPLLAIAPIAAGARLFTMGSSADGQLRLNTLELGDQGFGLRAEAIPSNLGKVYGVATNVEGQAFVFGKDASAAFLIERFIEDETDGTWERCHVSIDPAVALDLAAGDEPPLGAHAIWANPTALGLAFGTTVAFLPDIGSRITGCEKVVATEDSGSDPVNQEPLLENWTTIDFPGETFDFVGLTAPNDGTTVLHVANGGNLTSLFLTSPDPNLPPGVQVVPRPDANDPSVREPGLIATAVGADEQGTSLSDFTVARLRNGMFEVCDRAGACEPHDPEDCAPPYLIRVAGGALDRYVLDFEGMGAGGACARLDYPLGASIDSVDHTRLAGVAVVRAGDSSWAKFAAFDNPDGAFRLDREGVTVFGDPSIPSVGGAPLALYPAIFTGNLRWASVGQSAGEALILSGEVSGAGAVEGINLTLVPGVSSVLGLTIAAPLPNLVNYLLGVTQNGAILTMPPSPDTIDLGFSPATPQSQVAGRLLWTNASYLVLAWPAGPGKWRLGIRNRSSLGPSK